MSSHQKSKGKSIAELGGSSGASPRNDAVPEAIPPHMAEFLEFQEELTRLGAAPRATSQPIAQDDQAPPITPCTKGKLPVVVSPNGEVVTALPPPVELASQPTGSSTTPLPVVELEQATESRPPPPPAARGIVLGLRAASATPAAAPKGRKRPCANAEASKKKRCVKIDEAGPSCLKSSSTNLTSKHRAKFVSLIDGIIGECGSEVEHLAKELDESKEKSRRCEARLEVIETAHALEMSKLEARVGELERDLGKTASALLKEKKARKSKSSELRRLQRRLEKGESSKGCEVESAGSIELQSRLMRIASALDSLTEIYDRDVALAVVEISMTKVTDTLESEVETARLIARREELMATPGDFDQVVADLRSECLLPSVVSEPAAQDSERMDTEDATEGDGRVMAPNPGEEMSEDEAPFVGGQVN